MTQTAGRDASGGFLYEVLLPSRRVARKNRAEGEGLRRADSFRPSMMNQLRGPRTAKPGGENFAEEIAKQLAGN